MSPESWQFAGIVVVQVATLVVAVLARSKARDARDEATRAAEFSEPTGNGFARKVIDGLDEIRSELREVRRDMTDHLHDHSRSGMRHP